MPVQKQTRAGQRTRFKAFVAIGDSNGHVGLGVKCSKEVATAIRGAIIMAKLSIIPVRRGFWGNKIGKPHTVPTKVTGKCGSIWVRLIPAPRGTGIVSAPVPKKLLQMAGIEDCYTSARGSTGTLGNFGKFLNDYFESMKGVTFQYYFQGYIARLVLPAPLVCYSITPGNQFMSCRCSERNFLLRGDLKNQKLVSL